MADTAPITSDPVLPDTPNLPGAVTDTRDGITVESNTGTTEELKAGLDALDAAIEKAEPAREAKTGRFTSKERRSNPVARMEDAVAKEATAKRERDEAKAEAAKWKEQFEASQKAAPPAQAAPLAQPPAQPHYQAPPPPADPEPDPQKYHGGASDPVYLRDIGKWEARQEFRRQRFFEMQAQQREQHITRVDEEMKSFSQRMHDGLENKDALESFLKELPPDLANLKPSAVQKFLEPNKPITGSNYVADAIVRMKQPRAVLSFLKDHPDIVQRLSTLPQNEVFWQMGSLEATLAAAHTAPPSRPAARDTVSKARPPVQRVESVPQVSDAPPGDDASDEEHVAYYNRKEMARRSGRG